MNNNVFFKYFSTRTTILPKVTGYYPQGGKMEAIHFERWVACCGQIRLLRLLKQMSVSGIQCFYFSTLKILIYTMSIEMSLKNEYPVLS